MGRRRNSAVAVVAICVCFALLKPTAAVTILDAELDEAGGSMSEGFHLDNYLGHLMHETQEADASAHTEDGQQVVAVIALQTNEQQKQKQQQKHRQRARETVAADATETTEDTAGVAAGAEMKELLFHLDDAMREVVKADTGEKSGRKQKVTRTNGGATSVVANRNYMSIMEDAEGKILDPQDAAKEARFQQVEMKKQQVREKSAEAREKKEQLDIQNKQRKAEEASKKQTLELRSQTLEDEVKEAQEAAAKTNERNFKTYQREQQQRAQDKQTQDQTWSFGENWQNFGGHYGPATVAKRGNVCYLSGLVIGQNGTIGKVPQFCAPQQRLMFSVMRAGVTARIDMLGDGTLLLVNGIQHGWLSLSGVAYVVSPSAGNSTVPMLVPAWSNYGLSWRPTVVSDEGGVCLLSGLLRTTLPLGANWTLLGAVPDHCRPEGRLAFSDCNHEHITRVDMLPDGRFLKAGGYQEHGWVSLDGMAYTPAMGKEIDLLTDWKNYGGSYRPASYRKVGDICFVSGLVMNNETHWRDVATLPGECRPRSREVFACNNHAASARVDVDIDGTIRYISGRTEHNWLSLSCIHFVAASPVNEPVDIVDA